METNKCVGNSGADITPPNIFKLLSWAATLVKAVSCRGLHGLIFSFCHGAALTAELCISLGSQLDLTENFIKS